MISPVFFAGVNRDNAISELIPSRASVTYALIFFGALFLTGLAAFCWAILLGPQHRRRRSHRHWTKRAPAHQGQPKELRQRLTLAEAGGLPPVRNDKPPPPAWASQRSEKASIPSRRSLESEETGQTCRRALRDTCVQSLDRPEGDLLKKMI
jgi:hypothetical protein